MYCGNCGKNNNEDAKFCLSCGMRLHGLNGGAAKPEPVKTRFGVKPAVKPVPKPEPEEKVELDPIEQMDIQRKKRKVVVVASLLVVAVIAVCTYLWIVRDKYVEEGHFMVLQDSSGDDVLLYNGEEVTRADGIQILQTSVDGTSAVYYERNEEYDTTNVYWIEKNTAPKQLFWTEDLYSQRIVLASGGKGVAYTNGGTLYWKDTAGEEREIAQVESSDSFAISPNGKYVAYCSKGEWYCWRESSVEWLCSSRDSTLMAVSDKGMTYMHNFKNGVYAYRKDGGYQEVLSTDGAVSVMDRNRSGTQMIVRVTEGGDVSYYFLEKGKLGEELGGDLEDLELSSLEVRGTGDVANLKKQIYIGSGGYREHMLYLDRTLDMDIIVEDVTSYDMPYDDSAVYALDTEGVLYRVDPRNGETEDLDEDVREMSAAGKGVVYYMDRKGTLKRAKGDDTERVTASAESFAGVKDGSVLYVDEDGTLYRESKGGSREEVKDDVGSVWRIGKCYYIRKENYNDGYDIWFSKNGRTFENTYCGYGYNYD